VHGAVASDICIGLGGVTEAGRIASPRIYDHGASQTTMRDFIPFKNELIFSRAHKISVRLVIDPTNDPVSRRYDQADIVGIRSLNGPLAAGKECSLDCDVIVERTVSRGFLPGPTWSAGDALEDIWI
jgi:hypothetical protein